MSVFATFLRGVNMAGHCKIKMTDLSKLYRQLGYTDAVTYIQSGNIVLSSQESSEMIATKIEKGIMEEFGYTVPVMIRSIGEIDKIYRLNPFISEKDFDPAKSSVIFLNSEPDQIQISRVAGVDYPPDRFCIIGKEIFIYCPNGFGRTKLYTNFFEARMKVTGTARNWKTISAIIEIACAF
jgi:uncharacterized protein (DUF1697 family)